MRASLLSTVTRTLSKRRIVICDGLNYIKGQSGVLSLSVVAHVRPTASRSLTETDLPFALRFHTNLSAFRLSLPDELRGKGGGREGVHGQSFGWLPTLIPGRSPWW